VNIATAAYRGTGAVVDPIRDRAFTASGLGGFASGWFSFGHLEWTSGPNSGRLAEVMLHEIASGVVTITLLEAPVRAVAGGNAFTIRAGCDKRLETCRAKFANAVNFRGFPHIPGQDTITRYAKPGSANDGSVL